MCDQLNAFNLGQLLSFYENKIMFLGFLWGLNSWDQEGVQLGKALAESVINNPSEGSLLHTFLDVLKK